MNLPVLPVDKANHVMYGAIIAGIGCAIMTIGLLLANIPIEARMQHVIAGATGVIFATAAGIGKELMDKRANDVAAVLGLPPPHGVEVADALYTIQGGIIAMVPVLIVSLPHFVGK
jgi:hypothetical protein